MNNSLKTEGGWQESLPVEMARGYLAGKEPTVELMASFAVAYRAQESGYSIVRDFAAPEPQGATPEKRSEILKVAATADISSPAAMVAALEKIAMLCTEPSAPAETREPLRPYDCIYAVEHIRDGQWRLHHGMEVARERTTLEVVDMPKLRKDWPDAKWRITRYVPDSSAAAARLRKLRG